MRRPQQRRLHLVPLHAAVRLPEPAAAERRYHGAGSSPRRAGKGGGADGGLGRRRKLSGNERDGGRSERSDPGARGHQQPSNHGHHAAR